MTRLAVRMLRDQSGATIVEFAMIAPVLLTVLLGLFDLGHSMYTAQMLQGAIQRAARNSTIEGAEGKEASLDAIVTRAVRGVAPQAQLHFGRVAYSKFDKVRQPEDYTDVNANGTCDGGEPFEDANANGSWDLDAGTAGFGGARDAVLYSVTVTYKRPFPIFALIPGQTEDFTMVAQTVLRNQPYGGQAHAATPSIGNCS